MQSFSQRRYKFGKLRYYHKNTRILYFFPQIFKSDAHIIEMQRKIFQYQQINFIQELSVKQRQLNRTPVN